MSADQTPDPDLAQRLREFERTRVLHDTGDLLAAADVVEQHQRLLDAIGDPDEMREVAEFLLAVANESDRREIGFDSARIRTVVSWLNLLRLSALAAAVEVSRG